MIRTAKLTICDPRGAGRGDGLAPPAPPGEDSARETIVHAQAKMVKIYGAGGFAGLEAYQSGILISATGHILTVFSHALDTDYISATLSDGRRFEAKLLAPTRAGRGRAEDRRQGAAALRPPPRGRR